MAQGGNLKKHTYGIEYIREIFEEKINYRRDNGICIEDNPKEQDFINVLY